jgi:hypothetical protein
MLAFVGGFALFALVSAGLGTVLGTDGSGTEDGAIRSDTVEITDAA